jgi:hypothetical protein
MERLRCSARDGLILPFPTSSLHRTMLVLIVAATLTAAWTSLVLGWLLFFGSY